MPSKKAKPSYSRSPAIEVIYNIQSSLPQVADLSAIRNVVDLELKGFEDPEIFTLFKQTQNNLDKGTSFQIQADQAGFKYMARNQQHVVHMLRNGLVVNWLQPYPGYDMCLPKLKRYWKTYAKAFQTDKVERITLRYINQFELPITENKLRFKEYLNIGPRMPVHAGIRLRGFHQVLDLADIDKGIQGRATLMSLPPVNSSIPVILDIESSLQPEPSELWKGFDALHTWSHEVFKLSLNAKCRKLFE